MLLRLQRYDLQVTYVPGKQLVVADTLSRATDKSYTPSAADERAVEEMTYYVVEVMKVLPVSQHLRKTILEKISQDPVMTELYKMITEGWPTRKEQCTSQMRFYWGIQEKLSVIDGLIFKGLRLIVPSGMHNEMLKQIHEGHMGIEKSQRRARESIYWPGISKDIKEVCRACLTCIEYSKAQQQEELMPHPGESQRLSGITICRLCFSISRGCRIIQNF